MAGSEKILNIALVGNPNSGKTTLFNILTGLHFKTGNFPGVTVDRRIGFFSIGENTKVRLIDLPGTYSLHPNSIEEAVNLNYFIRQNDSFYPDVILFIADSTALDKQMLLFHQLLELGIPIILALNMSDTAQQYGIEINIEAIYRTFGVRAVPISARTGQGLDALKALLADADSQSRSKPIDTEVWMMPEVKPVISLVKQVLGIDNSYLSLLAAEHIEYIQSVDVRDRERIQEVLSALSTAPLNRQIEETMNRFKIVEPFIARHVQRTYKHLSTTEKIDRWLTHRILGPLLFLFVTFLLFQAVFSLAEIPMNWIDGAFVSLQTFLDRVLPDTGISHLLTDGILSGINGVVIFIPQIAIMFFFIVVLEESGYMARVVFMFDRIMRVFGMNGRSLVALISSSACAIPAIMSTRTIKNRKQRLITLFVAPFISCSARIPVYTILLALVVPNIYWWGWVQLQGVAFLGLYLIGALMALIVAFIMKRTMPTEERGFLMIQLPSYRIPHWKSVVNEVYDKVRSFVWTAGKIILFISILLWIASNTSMPGKWKEVEETYTQEAQIRGLNPQETQSLIDAKKLEYSFAGQFGKFIEPAIRPLGYDWKIGIALLTSFAAREVFVGTLSTIYSVEEDRPTALKEKIRNAVDPLTGDRVFSRGTTMSLLVFYILAMQCMSTLAVVKKETQTWKWPVIQFVVMTGMAYLLSWITYEIFK